MSGEETVAAKLDRFQVMAGVLGRAGMTNGATYLIEACEIIESLTRPTCNATLQVPVEPSGEVRERVGTLVFEWFPFVVHDPDRHGPGEFEHAAWKDAPAFWREGINKRVDMMLAILAPAIDGREIVEQAAALLEKAIADGYPQPAGRYARCEHGRYGWEDCIACYDEALTGVVTAIRDLAGEVPTDG